MRTTPMNSLNYIEFHQPPKNRLSSVVISLYPKISLSIGVSKIMDRRIANNKDGITLLFKQHLPGGHHE
jgi:hypothetical protein